MKVIFNNKFNIVETTLYDVDSISPRESKNSISIVFYSKDYDSFHVSIELTEKQSYYANIMFYQWRNSDVYNTTNLDLTVQAIDRYINNLENTNNSESKSISIKDQLMNLYEHFCNFRSPYYKNSEQMDDIYLVDLFKDNELFPDIDKNQFSYTNRFYEDINQYAITIKSINTYQVLFTKVYTYDIYSNRIKKLKYTLLSNYK